MAKIYWLSSLFALSAGLILQSIPSYAKQPHSCIASLASEQLKVQANKNRNRTLAEYDKQIFKSSTYSFHKSVPRPNEFLRDNFKLKNSSSVAELLSALSQNRSEALRWSDVGGGLGVAQRQVKREFPSLSAQFELVDLIDWENAGDTKLLHFTRNEVGPTIFNPEFRPSLVLGDATTAPLNRPTLITSVESIQYINDKLAALIHWYNSLEDGGLMVVVSEHRWANTIRSEKKNDKSTAEPFLALLRALHRGQVPFAINPSHPVQENGDLAETSVLYIRKVPGTRLQSHFKLIETWTNSHGYQTSYYKADATKSSSASAITVLSSSSTSR